MNMIKNTIFIALCFLITSNLSFAMNSLIPFFHRRGVDFVDTKLGSLKEVPCSLSSVQKTKEEVKQNFDLSKQNLEKMVEVEGKVKKGSDLFMSSTFLDFKRKNYLFNLVKAIESKNIYEQKILEPIVKNVDIFENILKYMTTGEVSRQDRSLRKNRRFNDFYRDYCRIKEKNPNIFNIMAKQDQEIFEDSLEAYFSQCTQWHRRVILKGSSSRFVNNL